MYTPVEQTAENPQNAAQSPPNPQGMLDQGPQKEDTCCITAFCWIFQILCWATLILSCILVIKSKKALEYLHLLVYLILFI